jgi:hypothetical protein
MTFEFTLEEINIILQSLGMAPYVQVFPLVAKIQQQAQTQLTTEHSQQTVPTPLPVGVATTNVN